MSTKKKILFLFAGFISGIILSMIVNTISNNIETGKIIAEVESSRGVEDYRDMEESDNVNYEWEDDYEDLENEKDEETEIIDGVVDDAEDEHVNQLPYSSYDPTINGTLTKLGGVNYFNGRKETWYNLDMSQVISNAQSMGIQGEYWIREDGVKMYGDYVIVAAQMDKGTIIETSLGTGIVIDWCPAGTIDIAVAW